MRAPLMFSSCLVNPVWNIEGSCVMLFAWGNNTSHRVNGSVSLQYMAICAQAPYSRDVTNSHYYVLPSMNRSDTAGSWGKHPNLWCEDDAVGARISALGWYCWYKLGAHPQMEDLHLRPMFLATQPISCDLHGRENVSSQYNVVSVSSSPPVCGCVESDRPHLSSSVLQALDLSLCCW